MSNKTGMQEERWMASAESDVGSKSQEDIKGRPFDRW